MVFHTSYTGEISAALDRQSPAVPNETDIT
jgi:hypothetical protein